MIFDLHSDILSELGKAPESWDKIYRKMFTQAEGFGGIWVAWINGALRESAEATEGEFLRLGALAHRLEGIGVVKTSSCLGDLPARGLYPIVLGVEGLDNLGFSAEQIFNLGFRHAMLTWMHPNAYAGGNLDPSQGLTAKGRAFIREMERLGMLIDLSHLNERSFWDVCACTDAPLMASHSNAAALCPQARNLDDRQILELSRRRGLIGLNVVADFVAPAGGPQPLEFLARHMGHILELTGDASLPALGPDWCAFLNSEFRFAEGYNSAADSAKIPALLKEAGLDKTIVEAAAHKNALAYLKRNLPA